MCILVGTRVQSGISGYIPEYDYQVWYRGTGYPSILFLSLLTFSSAFGRRRVPRGVPRRVLLLCILWWVLGYSGT